MKLYSYLLLAPAFFLDAYLPAVATPTPDYNPWQDVRNPTTRGSNEAIGFYSAGCLSRAEKIPADGEGYHVMRLSRNRFWAHSSLKKFLNDFAPAVKKATGDNLLIGDTAQPRGGPFTTGHASHQIGLDMDIWFMQASEARFQGNPTSRQREQTEAKTTLNPRGYSYPDRLNPPGIPDLDPRFWGDKKAVLLKLAATHPDVERIFVHPYIKKDLCARFGGFSLPGNAWLRKVRPWWGHHYHFHVRLKCPKNSPDCRVQESVPPGDGCTDDLGWWFTTAAQAEWRRIQEAERDSVFKLPKLPERCAEVLR